MKTLAQRKEHIALINKHKPLTETSERFITYMADNDEENTTLTRLKTLVQAELIEAIGRTMLNVTTGLGRCRADIFGGDGDHGDGSNAWGWNQ